MSDTLNGEPTGRFFDGEIIRRDGHPAYPQSVDFDWPGLYELLGEARVECGSDAAYSQMASALSQVLRWVVRGIEANDSAAKIGRRAIALCWVINPDIFGGASARTIAKRIGCHHVTLCQDVTSASRRFGMRNRAQASVWNFKPQETGTKGTNDK
jgi:hypothetical protein